MLYTCSRKQFIMHNDKRKILKQRILHKTFEFCKYAAGVDLWVGRDVPTHRSPPIGDAGLQCDVHTLI